MKATTMFAMFALVLAALALAAVPATDAAVDDEFAVNGISYQVVSEDAVAVIGADASVKDLALPDKVKFGGESYDVSAIADKAFMNNAAIRTADLGAVSKIGMKAFAQCPSLTTVTALNVSTVGAYAFYGDARLAVVDIEGPAKAVIGAGAFTKCPGIYQLTLPAKLAKVGDSAFSALTFVDADGEKIDKTASALKGKTFLGRDAKLTPVDLVVGGLGYRLVSDCEYEVCAVAPGVTVVSVIDPFEADGEFYDVVSIAKGVFKNNTEITAAFLGPVEDVGDYAFYNCSALVTLDMPCVKTVGFKAFANCGQLVSDTYSTHTVYRWEPVRDNGDEPMRGGFGGYEWKLVKKTVTTKTVSFGSGPIEQVGAYAFWGCESATTVNLAFGAEIGSYAFHHSNIKVNYVEF